MMKADPWVGTWRPHKPRGPIAALYGSPGPKYALPGLTGSVREFFFLLSAQLLLLVVAVVFNKGVFFFYDKGVSQHDPTKCKAPMFSFGMRRKEVNNNVSPGPRYLIPTNMTREGLSSMPSFSLHSRPKEPKFFEPPGPGQQNS